MTPRHTPNSRLAVPLFMLLCGTFLADGPTRVGDLWAAQGALPQAAGTAIAQLPVSRTELRFDRAEQRKSWQFRGDGYDVGIDPEEGRSGGGSLRLRLRRGTVSAAPSGFGVAVTQFPVEAARGRHLRLEGWIKSQEITRGWAGLWVRVDGPAGALGFDNMADRGVHGTSPWSHAEVEMDVPQEAAGIALGALLAGDGAAWVSDLSVSLEPLRQVVEGRVLDPSGRPVRGALVAVLLGDARRAAAMVRTGGDGIFHATVAAGRYALTATAAGFAAGFQPPGELHDQAQRGATIKLGGGCVNLIGSFEAMDDRPPAGTLVSLARSPRDGGGLFYGELDGDGRFTLRLSPARYTIALESADFDMPPVKVEVGGGCPDRRVRLTAARLAPAPESVVSWLRGHVVPLRFATAGHGFEDLRPLAAMVGRARVVGLGEATHGTREFFQLKHRVLEYLVSELGFTVFAIEAGWPESRAIDDYVLHGTGDPVAALASLNFWTWDTEEVLDMIRWMRAYDADPLHARKVRFFGFDMQFTRTASSVVAAYLEKVDPAYAKEVEAALGAIPGDPRRAAPAANAAALSAARAVLARLDARKDAYFARCGAQEWDLVRQHAVILIQATQLAVPQQPADRERAMADNIGWILARQPPGTGMVVWAHNAHISYASVPFVTPLGEYLRRKLGAGYMNIGFVFDQGSFQATRHAGPELAGPYEVYLGPGRVDDLAAAFHRTGIPLSLLDLRSRPMDGPVAAWLTSPHPMREVGALFSGEEAMTDPVIITRRFDAVLYVDRTTRARPIPPHAADAAGTSTVPARPVRQP